MRRRIRRIVAAHAHERGRVGRACGRQRRPAAGQVGKQRRREPSRANRNAVEKIAAVIVRPIPRSLSVIGRKD